jgi:hypothetical protein
MELKAVAEAADMAGILGQGRALKYVLSPLRTMWRVGYFTRWTSCVDRKPCLAAGTEPQLSDQHLRERAGEQVPGLNQNGPSERQIPPAHFMRRPCILPQET